MSNIFKKGGNSLAGLPFHKQENKAPDVRVMV